MALEAPSFFDDLARMRATSRPYDPGYDYSIIVRQLIEACSVFPYRAISPQNLVAPAELLPAIVARQDDLFLPFVNPHIIRSSGQRRQREGCANIFLTNNGEKRYPIVLVDRPTEIMIEFITEEGDPSAGMFIDSEPGESVEGSLVGAICHEIDHLNGTLIVDFARSALVRGIDALRDPFKILPDVEGHEGLSDIEGALREFIISQMPLVLLREGNVYMVRHGHELEGREIPPVSPDALFVDGFFETVAEISDIRVPRGGQLISLVASDAVLAIFK